MKELDIIFSSLSRRLGITDESAESVAIETAKLEVLGLLMRQQVAKTTTRPDSIVKVRRGGSDGAN